MMQYVNCKLGEEDENKTNFSVPGYKNPGKAGVDLTGGNIYLRCGYIAFFLVFLLFRSKSEEYFLFITCIFVKIILIWMLLTILMSCQFLQVCKQC